MVKRRRKSSTTPRSTRILKWRTRTRSKNLRRLNQAPLNATAPGGTHHARSINGHDLRCNGIRNQYHTQASRCSQQLPTAAQPTNNHNRKHRPLASATNQHNGRTSGLTRPPKLDNSVRLRRASTNLQARSPFNCKRLEPSAHRSLRYAPPPQTRRCPPTPRPNRTRNPPTTTTSHSPRRHTFNRRQQSNRRRIRNPQSVRSRNRKTPLARKRLHRRNILLPLQTRSLSLRILFRKRRPTPKDLLSTTRLGRCHRSIPVSRQHKRLRAKRLQNARRSTKSNGRKQSGLHTHIARPFKLTQSLRTRNRSTSLDHRRSLGSPPTGSIPTTTLRSGLFLRRSTLH